jgi:hypothetical protein
VTASRSRNGEVIKQRWKDAEVVGSRLGITKFNAYNYLMTMIIEKGWLAGAKTGDAEIVAAIKETDEWRRMSNQPPPIHVMDEEDDEDEDEGTNQRRRHYAKGGKDGELSAGEKINIAFWMIRKIGSVAEAKIALDVASQAVEKLEKKAGRLK